MNVVGPELLSGDLGGAVMDSWKPFSAHSAQCEQCAAPFAALRGIPDDPFPSYDSLCDNGRALFVEWTDAKLALIARLRDLTSPWGMAGLVGDEAEERSEAIVAMPPPAAAALFRELDVERREAQICAVIAAHRAGGVMISEREEERRTCAAPDCATGPYGTPGTFAVSAKFPRRRYCCDLCRKRHQRAERPRIESTED